MQLSEKTPERLVLVSLFFSAAHFLFSGINGASIVLFLVFTATVFASVKLFLLLQKIEATALVDVSELKAYLSVLGVLFISIATFNYSWMFGLFYGLVIAVYFISPYDRAWLTGKAELVLHENKVEYRAV
ncbi:MAG: hypothetical protein IPM37_07210 [Hahellaceae bacterium]|jgi:hypothetical protein|nr:hypothetical protein [Hahellaceae bacterium]